MEDIQDFNGNESNNYLKDDQNQQLNVIGTELTWRKLFLFIITYFAISIGVVFVVGIFFAIIDVLLGTNMINALDQIQYLSLLELATFVLTMLVFRSVRDYLKGSYYIEALKKWQTYLYLIVAYIGVYISQYLFNYVLEWEQPGSQVDLFGLDQIGINPLNFSLLILAFVVIAPITEEIIFRGLIFGFIKDKFGLIAALLISSAIFGLLHPGHHLSTFVMGVAFALLYDRTKSIAVPIVLHMVWNALATYGLLSLVISS